MRLLALFLFFLPSPGAFISVRYILDLRPLFQASAVPLVSFTTDGLQIISLRASRCPMLVRRLQTEKGAAGTDEPWEEHFCINIANDHHLNRNTVGRRRQKGQYWTIFRDQAFLNYLADTHFHHFWFPPINEMKNLPIFQPFKRMPVIPVLYLFVFAKWKCQSNRIMSLILGGGDPVSILGRLSSFKRGGGPCPGQGTGAHPSDTSLTGQWLHTAAGYLAALRGNSARAKTLLEVGLKNM